MVLLPAIDLVAGRVVRLSRGDRSKMDVYSDDPVAVARDFAASGATWVHVVDLSAAFGEDERALEANRRAISAICELGDLKVDTGGGVRSMDAIERLAQAGATRIAVGTALVRDADFAREAARRYGAMLAADVAGRDGMVRVNGWREGAGLGVDELVSSLAAMGYRHLVYTDVARDGMQSGIDGQAYRHVAQVADFPVVASGGIASLDDVRRLAGLGDDVVEGAITGRAIYEGSLSLREALAVAVDEGDSVTKGEAHAD